MKKIILLGLLPLLLVGCAAQTTFTPVIHTSFSLTATVQTGDFSYTCVIKKQGDTVSVSPTSTHAAGMTISCNGREVTFSQEQMTKTFPVETVDKTNPAIVLYEVFTAIEDTENCSPSRNNGMYTYRGKTGVGNFVLYQTKQHAYQKIILEEAGITVIFAT